MSEYTGNKDTNNFQLMDVLIQLKNNIMRDLNVCKICKVIEKKNDYVYMVSSINNENQRLYAFDFCESKININDIVIVIFTDEDNRINLNKILNEEKTQIAESINMHALEYGVIINKLKKLVQD